VTEQPDRSQLEQIIAGLTEGVVLIEPDRTVTYANGAALAMHGVAYLDELGRTVDEYRRNFVVSHHGSARPVADSEHPAERVLAGEAFSDVLVGVVHRERPDVDWVHRVRGLVITDRDGRPDVLALVVHDATDWHEAERRFEQTFGANPAPAVILRLADMRYVKLNDGFLEMTGLGSEDVLGRTFDEVDVLAGAERRELALERLRAGETIPQMEACLRVPVDSDKLVVVAGQPIELGVADEPCMLFTFADLEPRRRAEAALRQSEERFVTCFRLAPIPLAIGTVEGYRFVDANEAFCEATGHGAGHVVGRGAAELGLWADEEARERFEAELTRAGRVSGLEARLRPRDGAELDCLLSAEVVAIGDRPCFLWAFQDITLRKRSEGELVAAIEAVMADASWFGRGVVEKLALVRSPPRPGQGQHARLDDLTAREREVLTMICRGLGDAEIGRELGLSANTVRNHVAAVYRKLGINRRSAVVVWGRERGIGDAVLANRHPSRKQLG